jgi:DNA polymerase V
MHTASTPRLLTAAGELLERIYRPGVGYKKAGVLLYDLRPVRAGQPLALYTASGAAASNAVCEQQADAALMGAMDTLNAQYGRGTVRLASSGAGKTQTGTKQPGTTQTAEAPAWAMKRNRTSPRYTTRWTDLPVAQTA